MLFFQLTLLAGYGYAHWLQSLAGRTQAILHSILLAGSLALLPILPGERWKPTQTGDESFLILLLLAATIGAPYFFAPPPARSCRPGTVVNVVLFLTGSSRSPTWPRCWLCSLIRSSSNPTSPRATRVSPGRQLTASSPHFLLSRDGESIQVAPGRS